MLFKIITVKIEYGKKVDAGDLADDDDDNGMSTREVTLIGGSPWGFRMNGGSDQPQPLRVSRVSRVFFFFLHVDRKAR